MEAGKALLLAVGLLLATPLAADAQGSPPLTYSAKPMEGVVVEAGTGTPLEGVIVVAQWILWEPGPGSYRRLHVYETVTDAAGKYRVPGWGPKLNPGWPRTFFQNEDPALSLFKPGYKPGYAQNRWTYDDAVRVSEWDGKTIQLERFTGTPDEWADELRFLQGSFLWEMRVVDWRAIPRMALAIEQERLRLMQMPNKPRKLLLVSPLSTLGPTMDDVRRFLEGRK